MTPSLASGDSPTGPRRKLQIEVDESGLGPCTFGGTLEAILPPEALPPLLRERLSVHVAVVRILDSSLRPDELPFSPLNWLVLFPRSVEQDLREDLRSATGKASPVVVYAYHADDGIGEPLVMERMRDIGLGTVGPARAMPPNGAQER